MTREYERGHAALATARRDALEDLRKKWVLRDLTPADFSEEPTT